MDSLNDHQFEQLRRKAYALWGLDVKSHKREMVQGRLRKLVVSGQADSLASLVAALDAGVGDPLSMEVFDALSTNMTSFFRENDHFDCVRDELLEPLLASGRRRPLRFWSAACSKGCEPYSLAMLLRDTLSDIDSWDVKILASDLARSVVDHGRRGIYEASWVEGLDPKLVERHFIRGKGAHSDKFRVTPELSRLVTFALVNLNGPWVHKGLFDVIFCRNVMIYFDEPTREKLVGRLQDMLKPGGLLIVGSSEALNQPPVSLTRVRPAVYRAA